MAARAVIPATAARAAAAAMAVRAAAAATVVARPVERRRPRSTARSRLRRTSRSLRPSRRLRKRRPSRLRRLSPKPDLHPGLPDEFRPRSPLSDRGFFMVQSVATGTHLSIECDVPTQSPIARPTVFERPIEALRTAVSRVSGCPTGSQKKNPETASPLGGAKDSSHFRGRFVVDRARAPAEQSDPALVGTCSPPPAKRPAGGPYGQPWKWVNPDFSRYVRGEHRRAGGSAS